MLWQLEKITFAWVDDVVILMAKIPFTGRSKHPNPLNKNFPWGCMQTLTMKCGSPHPTPTPTHSCVHERCAF